MELLQLHYFLALAKHQHVSRTAELLNISQPSLSATIKKLESELGAPLFLRKGRNIVLSPYGEAYKTYVEEAFFALENGKRAVQQLSGFDDRKLNLGILSPYVWTDVFHQFHELYPDVQVNRYSIEGLRYYESILSGSIDLYMGGINQIEALDTSKLEYVTLYEDEMVLMVNKSHPLAAQKEVDLRQCSHEHFINLDASTNLQQFISHLYEQSGFTPKVMMVCDYTLRDRMVSENHGVSVTTKLAAQKAEVDNVTFLTIKYPAEKRKLGLVWRKNRVPTKSMQNFCDAALEFYRNI